MLISTAKKKKSAAAVVQSDPPRVGLTKIFKDGVFPIGEEVEYANEYVVFNVSGRHLLMCSTTSRITSEEARERERLAQEDPSDRYSNIRRAAEAHRQVRAYAKKNIKPGMSMTEIANMIEDGTRALIEENGFDSGIGFPTGLSVNEVAAHYTPNAGDTKSEMVIFFVCEVLSWLMWDSFTKDRCDESRLWHSRQRPDSRFRLHNEL